MARDRVVIDTNVFVSGLLSVSSTPARVVERVVAHHQLLVSTETLLELMETLLSKKFDRYVAREDREALVDRLAPIVETVEIVLRVRECRDSCDDKFLEVAANGAADVLITGDADLLALHPFRGVRILRPSEYLSGRQRLLYSTYARGCATPAAYEGEYYLTPGGVFPTLSTRRSIAR